MFKVYHAVKKIWRIIENKAKMARKPTIQIICLNISKKKDVKCARIENPNIMEKCTMKRNHPSDLLWSFCND